MRMAMPRVAYIFMIMLGLCAIPAHAQLASYVDGNGNLVFTNPAPPVARRDATKSIKKASPVSAAKPTGETTVGSSPSGTGDAGTPAVPGAAGAAAKSTLVPVSMEPAALSQVVQRSAEKNHVDPALVRAVISTESNCKSSAVSSNGALGLMQLIPVTAERMGVGNAFDPVQNVEGGTRYLAMLLQRYNGDVTKAVAAYNAGPGAVDRFGGVPDYRETRNYVQKVTSSYFGPESDREPHAFVMPRPIYRTLDPNGRVVFSNE
jgi:soluble lytic murein transglycosylase-like protein